MEVDSSPKIIKYLNSAESDIFKKEDNLFGLYQAKDDIERQGYVILLEGYFDFLTAHQNGITNTVASLGTTLTTNQAPLLKDITNDIVIAYDGERLERKAVFVQLLFWLV